MMLIGERIKMLRKENHLTQKQLAEKTGLAEITIRNYEAGKYEPKYEQAQTLASALGVSDDFFLRGDKECEFDKQIMKKRLVVKSRLSSLLGERKLKIAQVSRDTGISRTTLYSLYYETGAAVSFDVLSRLCTYFNCGVGDILETREEN